MAKAKAARSRKPGAPATKRRSAAPAARDIRWSRSELPVELQDELRSRLEAARRGDRLIPFDEAMAEAERMADEIVVILDRAEPRRPAG